MKRPTKEEKHKLSRDTKSYYVTAVLDKATSDRLLRPLPTEVVLRGKDGTLLTLSHEPPTPRKARR